jgi:hypothetical protein
MGKVSQKVFEKIDLADEGRLGTQLFNFNVKIGKDRKVPNSFQTESTYQQAYVLNGHCRFKKYSLLDVIAYKVVQLLFGRSKYGAQKVNGR